MSEPASSTARGPSFLGPILIVLIAMGSFQVGASFAKQLFPLVGPQGASALRLTLSACILWSFNRPWRGPIARAAIPPLIFYGVALAGLNFFFYLAVQRIPLGVAVAIDFLGPLAVAVLHSRRRGDLAWVALAVVGIVLLAPIGGSVTALDPLGVIYCGGAALSWAFYIVFGRKVGSLVPSGHATAIGVALAAVLILPLGIAQAGWGLLSLSVLPLAAVVATLSSALPNSLEMIAMKRLPAQLFGLLMSLEPAVGALCGWLILGEALTSRQEVAIVCVVLASGGATLTTSNRLIDPG